MVDAPDDAVMGRARLLYAALRNQPHAPASAQGSAVALLNRCEQFYFGEDKGVVGWTVGEGPLVCLVHGWGGRGAQMAPLAMALAAHGFRAVFFDAGNHGGSLPKPSGFDRFMADCASLCRFLGGRTHGWVGHSAGALAQMSARTTHGLKAARYACIAPPFYPYVPIDRMREAGGDDAALLLVQELVARQFGADWATLVAGRAWRPDGGDRLLTAYDDDDEVVRPTDAALIGQAWPGTEMISTSGLGHNGILKSEHVITAVVKHMSC